MAILLSLPFLLLFLADTGNSGLTVAVAALTPMAALAGAAVRRREESREYHAAREDILGTLLEHTARGERKGTDIASLICANLRHRFTRISLAPKT